MSVFQFKKNWLAHAQLGLNRVLNSGGIFHLYFHSWEIEEYSEWGMLEDAFELLAGHSNVDYLTNGELFKTWNKAN